ncbi:homoserine kinase [Fructobacillus ficulneus]|uniref:Homoserine kinase n=1 Tax=Fructobacillus ficulneus TaxID=157463 RepID=A0A0K8MIU9_9LACO|nr:homoserine kinase [Fructobacillus ficulneus]GAP00461.1 homoserine kinase [Fructobacillus ficulneus]
MLTITVPASSANLGLGFDCLGLALDFNLTLTLGEARSSWLVHHPYGPEVPTNEENLVIETALMVDPSIQPYEITVTSQIPLARGLGSSSSALVAGLALGHWLAEGKIDKEQIFQESAALEGHPDNVAPTIFGGLQLTGETATGVKTTALPFPNDLAALTFIPNYPLKTAEARAALPAQLPLKSAALQSQRLANLVVACYEGDTRALQHLVEGDHLHEPFRASLAPEFLTIRAELHRLGLAGTYLSGAGPTVVSLINKTQAQPIEKAINQLDLDGQLVLLPIQSSGLQINKTND